jgi:acetyl-CoA/propionyl-CoA carboxylase biotin carboxyl carrier protein
MERGERRTFEVEVNRKLFHVSVAELTTGDGRTPARRREKTRSSSGPRGNDLPSPMNGTVVGVRKAVGDTVEVGEVLFVIEAMKMENEVAAHRAGTLSAVDVAVGDSVETGRRLAAIQ